MTGKLRTTMSWTDDALPALHGPARRVLVLLLASAYFVVPLIWLVLAPTKTTSELASSGPLAFGSVGDFVRTLRLTIAFQGHSVLIWLKNSAIYSFGGTALAVLAAIPAGYGLALTEFIGRRVLLSITLVVMIMPATALVLPLFLEINKLGLYGTIWSLILPFGFFPFGVFLAYIYFSSTIPRDLLAAARIDGANEWAVFRHIAVPLARPIIGLVGFFAFVASWNNFFLPFVMTYTDSQYSAQVGLQQLVSQGYAGQGSGQPVFAMAVILTCSRLDRISVRAAAPRGRHAGGRNDGLTLAGAPRQINWTFTQPY